MKKLILCVSWCLIDFYSAQAGWKIITVTEQDGYTTELIMYFEDNKMKIEMTEGFAYIYNLETKNLLFINNNTNKYWQGTLEQLEKEMQAMMEEMMGQFKDIMAEENQEKVEQMLEREKPPVKIVAKEDMIEVAGYKGKLHQVYLDDELVEEIWISKDINIQSEFDMTEFNNFTRTMRPTDALEESYDNSEEYMKFYSQGFYVMMKDYNQGEVVSVNKLKEASRQEIPASVFTAPAGYAKTGVLEVMGMK